MKKLILVLVIWPMMVSVFGQNQRKPRVFKASNLCPYYNSIVNSPDNTCCFHSIVPFTYKFKIGIAAI